MDETSRDNLSNSLKRPSMSNEVSRKKVRLSFAASEFRNQIKSEQKTQALQDFLQLIDDVRKHDVILTYFEGGGSVLEIIHLVEGESGVSPMIVFGVLNKILLVISTSLPQFQKSAYEGCRYLLNNFLSLINKMLGLSSTANERLVALRLLTTMVTCSAALAKEILLRVNFNRTNLQLLTKFGEVRTALIHFIVAFLVEGHFTTMSVLLEKNGLISSIIRGLQYDNVDTVVLVLTAMKNHILENGSVTKTTKMKTFNTIVIKNIVNLYNWKGPAGLIGQKSKTSGVAVVDEVEKSKVNEAVHSFLLLLCTSHRHGVIFKDPLVGVEQRQNPLMFTVLGSLERPWEHSYASELVVKICRACPDLTKTMWYSLRPFLEPRWTESWIKSVEFAERLLHELQPDCIERNNLNVHQMTQIITIMTSPLPILKILIPKNGDFGKLAVKYRVISLILRMLESLERYLKRFNNELLDCKFADYIGRKFPDAKSVLRDWDRSDSDCSASDYLDTALDLIEKYRRLAPQVLLNCNLSLDVKDFMSKSENINENVKVKAVSFLITLEPTHFSPKSELFQTVLTSCMEYYHDRRESKVLQAIHLLLKNSSIFDHCESEIDYWIDGILNVKNYDESVPMFLCTLIRKVSKDATEYNKKLCQLKNVNFSPMVLALTDHDPNEFSKVIRNYLVFVFLNIFHIQIDSTCFLEIVSKLQFLPKSLTSYFENWNSSTVSVLGKCKGIIVEHFSQFSNEFLENSIQEPVANLYPNFKLNLLQNLMFYLTNLIQTHNLQDNHKKNCEYFFDQLFGENVFDNESNIKTVLGNSKLLRSINFLTYDDFLTKFLISFVKRAKGQFVENHLRELRDKIVALLSKIFGKPRKYQNSVITIEILEVVGLGFEQCKQLISKFLSSYDNQAFFNVACYCLNRMSELEPNNDNSEGLSDELVEELYKFLTLLIKQEVPNLNQFSLSLHNYLRTFSPNPSIASGELFHSLVRINAFNRDNLALGEFLLHRTDCWSTFVENLDEICSRRGSILPLLDVVIEKASNDDAILETIFNKVESHIARLLQKPHKAGQHFQNRYKSVGILIEKFMKPDGFGTQIQKFETTEVFHVYLLKKVFDKVEKNHQTLKNMILTFVHLLVNSLKHKRESLCEVCEIFYEFLSESENVEIILSNNEIFRTFYRLCLKHGVGGDVVVLKVLSQMVAFCQEEDGKLILEMLMSHSQFLDVILGDFQKDELMNLWLSICAKWPHLMERNHIPLLLSGYRATKADTITLKLLKMYESKSAETKFFDFKPFLWGRAAASHYSVRSDFQTALWRQPKMSDVLNNLHLGTIASTITDPSNEHAYDLDYFLPLFSHLLAPENPVPTYLFARSGALALALVGLRGDKSHRLAACHVLQRFYFHLGAKRSGKDTLLWLRFVEATCKGIAVVDDFRINNFVGVFLARTALVLAEPTHTMYVPLTQYLVAKDLLNFSTVPELYTFLHSPHVDSLEHRRFILEVLRDGLRNEKDFGVLLKSMGFKLISELLSSAVCDVQAKILILDVFKSCCRVHSGIGVLCGSMSFLTQMFSLVLREVQEGVVLVKLLEILLMIVETDDNRRRNLIVFLNMMMLLESEPYCQCLKESQCTDVYFKILLRIFRKFPDFFSNENVSMLKKLDDKLCKDFIKN